MAKAKLRILYGEGDSDVLAKQVPAFQKAGHTVQAVEGRKAVDEALKKATFDLVVLGSSMTRNDRHHLPDRKSTRLNSSHSGESRMPSSA